MDSKPKKPWRKDRVAVKQERLEADKILGCGRIKTQRSTAMAIVFCYEADNIIDKRIRSLDGLDGADVFAEAQHAVDRFRQAVTNDSSESEVENARCAAMTALRVAGLESDVRTALHRSPPGKWPVMHEIVPRVWCGGWVALNDSCRSLRQKGITRVISVVSGENKRTLPADVAVEHMHIPCHDKVESNLLLYFPMIVKFIERSLDPCQTGGEQSVYIHCGAGISRAPTAVIAWLMYRYKLTAAHGLAIVRGARPMARPNIGFVKQLKEWEGILSSSSYDITCDSEVSDVLLNVIAKCEDV